MTQIATNVFFVWNFLLTNDFSLLDCVEKSKSIFFGELYVSILYKIEVGYVVRCRYVCFLEISVFE